MYNSDNRYRCTIIRGKAQNTVEDIVSAYAYVIINSKGLAEDEFVLRFNEHLARFLSSPTQKTLDNHRTEIAGKLFGMYYFVNNELYVAERTVLVLENEDLPLFFKSIVWNFQFPNGMDSIQTIQDKIDNHIKLRPFHFIVALLKRAEERDMILTKNEIAYYVLDSKDVLQGVATIEEVLNTIVHDRSNDIFHTVQYPGKASSYNMQHITEQINLLELSGVILQKTQGHDKFIKLNPHEESFIDRLLEEEYNILGFDIYSYFNSQELNTKKMYSDWSIYFSLLPTSFKIEETKTASLTLDEGEESSIPSAVSYSPLDIGNEGENIVFQKEKERVKSFNARLSQQKVLLLGKQRGLGYDIQSVWADWANRFDKQADAAFYIEVKSTKRITKPSISVADKVILTRNEFLAAEQHGESYSIFRVYLTRSGTYVYKIFNPLSSSNSFCVPINYNYEFTMEEEIEKWG